MLYAKETTNLTLEEIALTQNEVQSLQTYVEIVDEKRTVTNFSLLMTMVDGKICNAATGTSSTMRCYLCNLTIKDFNKLELVLQQNVNKTSLDFGLSTLHSWIRLFECPLHIAYKLPVKKWQTRCKEEKELIAKRKKEIQQALKERLGLIIDKLKPGFGNSNDGNTARRFFENSKISAEITNLDLHLIERFHIIMQTISCGYEIDLKKFKEYCLETATVYLDLYPCVST